MPRFDSEGFNPEKRIKNDDRDRSVPDDENYYAKKKDTGIVTCPTQQYLQEVMDLT